jgi:hypothetical protein
LREGGTYLSIFSGEMLLMRTDRFPGTVTVEFSIVGVIHRL